MAQTSKKSAKKSAKKPTRKPTKKAAPKAARFTPDLYALREAWMKTKEEVAYQRRLLSRANGTQSSIKDREERVAAVNINLLEAHDAEKAAAHAFTSAQKKARRKVRT